MTPPAWSSLPATGLNFTSMKPSLMLVSFLMQTGKVAAPDCFNTFGLLGAESSFSTNHFAEPLPVCVAVHPGGAAPALKLSKFTVSADDNAAIAALASDAKRSGFIFDAFSMYPPLQCTNGVLTPDNPVTRSAPLTASANFLAEPLPQQWKNKMRGCSCVMWE